MEKYIYWNNKGGTGKTSLCFQSVVSYAEEHGEKHVFEVETCHTFKYSSWKGRGSFD